VSNAIKLKKQILKDTIRLLLKCRERNDSFVTVRKLRRLLERTEKYQQCTTNYLSNRVAMSLDWLKNYDYIEQHEENIPKRYFIPDRFEDKVRVLLTMSDVFS